MRNILRSPIRGSVGVASLLVFSGLGVSASDYEEDAREAAAAFEQQRYDRTLEKYQSAYDNAPMSLRGNAKFDSVWNFSVGLTWYKKRKIL